MSGFVAVPTGQSLVLVVVATTEPAAFRIDITFELASARNVSHVFATVAI